MSRVGKKPILIPEKTRVSFENGVFTATGAKGTLTRVIHPVIALELDKAQVVVKSPQDRGGRALQGLTRSLVNNMLIGVSQGFQRVLEINGIGYRAEATGKTVVLSIGYSQPIHFELPEGITASVEKNTVLKLSGIDKESLGLVAAAIRRLRPPEPYKGKGIKYAEERIQRKAGKTGTK